MKIRIASALTKPVMTERETKRISRPSLRNPAPIWIDAHQDGGGEQVLQAVLLHQRDHQNRGGGGGGRDHAGTSADEGGDAGDGERGIEPDLGVDAGDHRKADGFGDQREGDDDAGEDVATDVAKTIRGIRDSKGTA